MALFMQTLFASLQHRDDFVTVIMSVFFHISEVAHAQSG